MTSKTGGLDRFRVAAALLVVAVHTSPLASFSTLGDFMLTRVAARLAVPFFLMATGYFVLGDYLFNGDAGRLAKAVKKTLLLYLAAALLYLPLGIYAGHYRSLNPLTALKMAVFDGTFYHLWYLPGAALGLGLLYFLGNKLKPKHLLIISVCLYLVGLLGDSYYGLIKDIPVMSAIYDGIFAFTGQTRNGLFYAPLFLMLGAHARRTDISHAPLAFVLSFAAMCAEGLILRRFDLQLHDSMYLLLPLCVFALFKLLLELKAEPSEKLRTVSGMIYIIHPWAIVLVRLGAKLMYAGELFIDNSICHYLAVCALSIAAALIFAAALPVKEKGRRTWIELDMAALDHNVEVLRGILPKGCELMPAVKADAYGHGAITVARRLNKLGVRSFCVATADEGAQLRNSGVRGDILVLGYTPLDQTAIVRRYRLTQTAPDAAYALAADRQGKKIRLHLAVDTGMNRLGERCENLGPILAAMNLRHAKVTGLFTHLCAADCGEAGANFTSAQAEKFFALTSTLKERGYRFKAHILNSGGAINYPELGGDYARVGIALYGDMGTPSATDSCKAPLRPVLSLMSAVGLVKDVKAGENIGYGLCFTAERDMRIAVIPAGYADGVPRSLSMGAGRVIVCGEYAQTVGRVCMDQMTVDVTGLDVKPGDRVTIIGSDGDKHIRACDMAEAAGTISNEILSRLGKRLPQITR